jgi:hypothetical protein
MDISPDMLEEFNAWYKTQTSDDPDFAGITARQVISRAEAQGQKCLDELLNSTLREWLGINFVQLDTGNQFPTVRRKGGDDDRGFAPALNEEMRRRRQG